MRALSCRLTVSAQSPGAGGPTCHSNTQHHQKARRPLGARPWYSRWWALSLAALLLLGIGAAMGGGGSATTTSAASAPTTTVTVTATATATAAAAPAAAPAPASTVTVTQTAEPEPPAQPSSQAPAAAESTSATRTTEATTAEEGVVPDVVGEDLQYAQDTMQAAGYYNLSEEDATGQGRLLINDRAWIVVSQEPKAGTRANSGTAIVLRAKKEGE